MRYGRSTLQSKTIVSIYFIYLSLVKLIYAKHSNTIRSLHGISKHHHFSHPSLSSKKNVKNNNNQSKSSSCLEVVLHKIQRGGGPSSPLEPNPNYIEYNEYLPQTLGDEESNYIRRDISNQFQQQQYQYQPGYGNRNTNMFHQQNKVKPLQQVMSEFMSKLLVSSPTIYYGIITSTIIFISWQIPTFTNILRNHFVCSQMNILKYHRYHTLLTAAISHNSISHLLMNLYGFYIFGRNVESVLKMNQLPLPVFCILSALFSNLFFIQASPKGSSCIGLSGVTLSLLALDAKLHPSKEIGFVIRFVPVRLPAQYALTGLLIWSLIGMVQISNSYGGGDGVAHAVHFGGLVYGILMFEVLHRGLYLKMLRYVRKSWFGWKRGFIH